MGRLVVNNLDPDSDQLSLWQLLAADAMVLGRKTYEGLAAVWPTLADDPAMGVLAGRINSMPKYVASRSLSEPLEWPAGPRIFDDAGPVRLELIGSTTFASGVLRLAYRPAPDQGDGG